MQKILDYAAAKTGFSETESTGFAELVIGVVPGMRRVVGWVFRAQACFTAATGELNQIVDSFGNVPLRSLEADLFWLHPVGSGWRVRELVLRSYGSGPLRRIVAIGESGEASILFEADALSREDLASFAKHAIGKSLRDVVGSISR